MAVFISGLNCSWVIMKQVCVQPSTAAVSVTLLAFAADRRAAEAALSARRFWAPTTRRCRSIFPAPMTSSSKSTARDRQTVGRTPDRYTDPLRIVPINKWQRLDSVMNDWQDGTKLVTSRVIFISVCICSQFVFSFGQPHPSPVTLPCTSQVIFSHPQFASTFFAIRIILSVYVFLKLSRRIHCLLPHGLAPHVMLEVFCLFEIFR